jgi:hypothetical protein
MKPFPNVNFEPAYSKKCPPGDVDLAKFKLVSKLCNGQSLASVNSRFF